MCGTVSPDSASTGLGELAGVGAGLSVLVVGSSLGETVAFGLGMGMGMGMGFLYGPGPPIGWRGSTGIPIGAGLITGGGMG